MTASGVVVTTVAVAAEASAEMITETVVNFPVDLEDQVGEKGEGEVAVQVDQRSKADLCYYMKPSRVKNLLFLAEIGFFFFIV